MKGKCKGVVLVAVILYAVGAFLGGALLFKPVTNLLGISNEAKKHQEQVIKKKETKPVLVYTDEKGRQHIAMAVSEEYSNFEMTEQPKQTLWQKIKNLGVWGIILVCLGLAFPPVGVILSFIWAKVTAGLKTALANAENTISEVHEAHEEFSADAKKIVQSVDEGLATFDSAIQAARTAEEAANQSINLCSTITDAAARAYTLDVAQHSKMVAQAVANALITAKKDFLTAMSRKQDGTTKMLVAELKND